MFLSTLPSISLCAPLWVSQYLLCHVYSMDYREYLLSHEAPPFLHLLTSDPPLLFLTLFFFPILPVHCFLPFLNCVSQRCHQLGRGAQLCWITRSSSGNGCVWHRAQKPPLQPAPSYSIAMDILCNGSLFQWLRTCSFKLICVWPTFIPPFLPSSFSLLSFYLFHHCSR